MDIAEPIVFQIDDVTYYAWPCKHCGSKATERDVVEAVARYKTEKGEEKCLACGQQIAHASWDVSHTVDGSDKIWHAKPGEPCPSIVVRHAEGRSHGGGWLHLTCGRRALPYLPESFWAMPEKEHAAWRRMIEALQSLPRS